MKVLVNAVSARRGGIVTYTRSLQKEFHKAGIDATVALAHPMVDGEANTSFAVKVDGFSALHRLWWEQTTWRMIVKRHRPTVLFSSANFALLGCPVPQLLLMQEGGLFNPFYVRHVMPTLGARLRTQNVLRRVLMLKSLRAATEVMFPSETLRDWVVSFCPELAERGVVNSFGIDLGRLEPVRATPPARNGPIRLLYVSVYYPHKDPQTLFDAIKLLRARGVEAYGQITMSEPEFALWPAGKAVYRDLKRGEREGLLALGHVRHQDLRAAYQAHDIFVFPSVSETFGFPPVEAMAYGLPVIASDTLINREICGPAALYYPPFDAEILAARVQELRARPDLYRWLSEKGAERVRRRFNLSDHFSRLMTILERLHSERRSPA